MSAKQVQCSDHLDGEENQSRLEDLLANHQVVITRTKKNKKRKQAKGGKQKGQDRPRRQNGKKKIEGGNGNRGSKNNLRKNGRGGGKNPRKKGKKRGKVSQMAVLEAPWTAALKDVQGNLEPEYLGLVSNLVTKGVREIQINS